MDSAPDYPKSIAIEDENIKITFLPPNTISLLQPLARYYSIEVINDFEDLLTIDEEIKTIIYIARQFSEEGFADFMEEEMHECIE
ncbi:hypothetical protein QE152_g12641 [Popillia japonica]|uniref:DDE-1 domain-containing protein n=1 Tax=Popillia japonica TaxID=7064 RepID=A0AAW1LR70_POPJA